MLLAAICTPRSVKLPELSWLQSLEQVSESSCQFTRPVTSQPGQPLGGETVLGARL